MSIVVQCPHCQTKFNLQEGMNGKSMRCPNLDCRQVFTVKAQVEKPPAPTFEEVDAAPPAPVTKPSKPPKPGAPPAVSKPPKPKPAEPEVIEAAIVSPPKVKEVVWSADADEPPPPPKKRAKSAPKDDDESPPDDLPVRRRKKKGNRGPLLLAVMIVAIGGLVLAGVGYWLMAESKGEEQLAKKAAEEYDKKNYSESAKAFEELGTKYPNSKDAERYKFFADLSSTHLAVRESTNRADYDPAVKRFNEFVAKHKESKLAKPGEYAQDVIDAGKRVGEDVAGHADDRVKAFRADRTKSGELDRALKAVETGRALLASLDAFRGPNDPPFDELKKALDGAEAGVKYEKDRMAAVASARQKLASPTDAVIQAVEAELAAAGLANDDELLKLVAEAKARLRELVKYEEDRADPQPAPPTAAASVLFVTPIGRTNARTPAKDAPPTVFLCAARGILYALDENDGALLWATRVGADVVDPPAVADVDWKGVPTRVAVVTSNVGGAPAAAGHDLRTGAVLWYQPLTSRPRPEDAPVPAAAAGAAVVVNGRAFVPLRDPFGSLVEFDLATGARVGRISLGQPVADRSGVVRPGTNLLYVAADARRLFVIDTGGKDDNGNRVPPRCAQVVATGHLPGTVRVPPVFIGRPGLEPDPRRHMILAQANGTSQTRLRVFAVGDIPASGDGSGMTEAPPADEVPGWVTYPMVCDDERLAVATDTGHFRLFGINQPGNADRTVFPYAAPPAAPVGGDKTIAGLVLPVAESSYVVLAAGQLQKAELRTSGSKGQSVQLDGAPLAVGEPLHAGQVNARRDTACVTVRPLGSSGFGSSGCRAVAVNLATREIRWQRQLGVVPAAPPIAQAGKFILVDEDGGALAVPADGKVAPGQATPSQLSWVLAQPPASPTGPTLVTATPDGKTVYALTPVTRDGPKFVIRKFTNGKLELNDEAPAPAPVAGTIAVVGGSLLVPTSDGFVHRVIPGDGQVKPGALVPGPKWLGEPKPVNPVCGIIPLTDAAFATTDGGKVVKRWEWPAGGTFSPGPTWSALAEVTSLGVSLPGEAPRLAVADTAGGVWVFAADKPGVQLRRWKPGEGKIPQGKPGAVLVAQGDKLAYVADGKFAVGLDPAAAEAKWVRPAEDAAAAFVGAPQPAGDGRWLLTDLAGRVTLMDGTGDNPVSTQSVGLPGVVPAAASGVAGGAALTPLSDGSAVVLELPKK